MAANIYIEFDQISGIEISFIQIDALPAEYTADTTLITVDSTLITADNG